MRRAWGEPPWRLPSLPALAPACRAGGTGRPPPAATAEAIIIGAGLTGLAAAYHLARRGLAPLVLEAAAIGDGASRRTGGIVLDGTARGGLEGSTGALDELARLVALERIDCGLQLGGCWELEHRAPGSAKPPLWTDNGVELAVRASVPGGTVDPAALLGGLALAAHRAGARLYEHTAVKKLDLAPKPQLELAGTVIRPRLVIVALNAWMASMLPGVRPVTSAFTFACATEPLAPAVLETVGLAAGTPFYTIDLPYLWGRPLADGRVVFGSGLIFLAPDQLERFDIAQEEPQALLARLESRVRKLHPALENIGFSARWAGPVAIPENFTPIIGRMRQAPQVLVAGGYAGHGVALSVRAGRLLAEAALDARPLPVWSEPQP